MKDWIDRLAAELVDAGDEPPKGFKTRREIEKRLGLKTSSTNRWINTAMRAGKLQKVMVRRPSTNGIRSVPYYGPK